MTYVMNNFDAHIYGPFFSENGVGESTRAYWRLLTAIGLKVGILPQTPPFGYSENIIADDYKEYIVDGPHPKLNFYRINADEIKALSNQTFAKVRSRTNVLIPMWETEVLPSVWARDVERFDFAICATGFIAKSLEKTVPNLPTFIARNPIDVCISEFRTKRSLELRGDSKLYTYSFAYSSRVARKDPVSFLKLHDFRRNVCGIKGEQFLLLASDSPRNQEEFLVHEKLSASQSKTFMYRHSGRSRDEHLSLLASSNFFISPHRSEGIGLQLVEAAMLGTPFISHGYSGPKDFIPQFYPGLVSHKMIRILEGEYPYAHDQHWASVEFKEVSDVMNKMETKKNLLGNYLSRISELFSFRSTSEEMRNVIDEIAN